MSSPKIQFKRGSFSNLPDLAIGEPGFTTDFYDLYIGTSGIGTETNQFFGSGRYWERETPTTATKFKLFEASNNGTQSISLQTPNSLSGVGTIILPNTDDGVVGDALIISNVVGGVYTLEWAVGAVGAASGITINDEGGVALPEGVSGIGSVTTINFVGSGVTGSFDNTAVTGIATVRVYTASNTQEGTAKFSSSYFTVTSGDVSISDALADGTTKGISAFSSGDFVASSGVVSIGNSFVNKIITNSGELTSTNKIVNLNGVGIAITHTENTITFTNEFETTGILTTTNLNVTDNTVLGDNSSDTVTVNATATFNAPIVGTISTSTRSSTVDTTLTTTNFEYHLVFVDTNASSSGETIRVDSDGVTYNPSTNTLTSPIVNTAEIRHTNNTNALTIDTSGNLVAAQDFTISGNLFVNGTTTQVNTVEMTIEDTLIELGMTDGNIPVSDTNRDIGVIFNWFDTQARKAALFWDDSTGRINIARDVSENTSILTVSDWASVESGGIYITDADGSAEAVISYLPVDTLYSGQTSGRYLQNIVVDCGEF